jgi:hypothetical protein
MRRFIPPTGASHVGASRTPWAQRDSSSGEDRDSGRQHDAGSRERNHDPRARSEGREPGACAATRALTPSSSAAGRAVRAASSRCPPLRRSASTPAASRQVSTARREREPHRDSTGGVQRSRKRGPPCRLRDARPSGVTVGQINPVLTSLARCGPVGRPANR